MGNGGPPPLAPLLSPFYESEAQDPWPTPDPQTSWIGGRPGRSRLSAGPEPPYAGASGADARLKPSLKHRTTSRTQRSSQATATLAQPRDLDSDSDDDDGDDDDDSGDSDSDDSDGDDSDDDDSDSDDSDDSDTSASSALLADP